MTGTMTNPMSVDLGLWMEDRLFICPCLTFLLLYILNCSTLCLNKTFDFMILMLHLVAVYYWLLSSRFIQKRIFNTANTDEKISFSTWFYHFTPRHLLPNLDSSNLTVFYSVCLFHVSSVKYSYFEAFFSHGGCQLWICCL